MAAAFKQHVSKGIPFEGEWHAFFGFLRENIPHIKVVHKLDIDRMVRIKARLSKQKSEEKAREWYDERCARFKKNLVQLESSPYLSKIKEETYMHTFTLTPEYQSRLLALIEPQHFSSENPYFEMFELNQQQLESLSHTKPLFDGVYNPAAPLNAAKEVHIDVKYEELFTKPHEENIWLLTQTWSIPDNIQNNIPNSGTEFIKIPCLKPEFILSEKFDFRIYLQLHNHTYTDNSTHNTLCGQVLYTLTSLYCEEYTLPDQWQRIQPGILHNAARCYFHRSPQLVGILAPFERKHWVFDDYNLDSRLYAMIEKLRKSK
tara:strand:+ start:614 stop:1564 length:951 start_codon:yes stop_codon:yes gene_type:complete